MSKKVFIPIILIVNLIVNNLQSQPTYLHSHCCRIEWSAILPSTTYIYEIELIQDEYKPGFLYQWTNLHTAMECEVIVYDYFDDILWSGKGQLFTETSSTQPLKIVLKNMPKNIPNNIDRVLALYSKLKINAIKTPKGKLGKYKIYIMDTDRTIPYPTIYPQLQKVFSTDTADKCGKGSIAVIDKSSSAVILTNGKNVLRKIGSGVLIKPEDVESYNGHYFVLDKHYRGVLVFNKEGKFISKIHTGPNIERIAIKNDKMYAIDGKRKSIKVYSKLFTKPCLEREILKKKFKHGRDISVDEDENIYIADEDKLLIFKPSGELFYEIKGDIVYMDLFSIGKFEKISSVYVDEQGLIYIADSSISSAKIVVYRNTNNSYEVVCEIPPYVFTSPTDIILSDDGKLYVCDIKNELFTLNLNDDVSLAKPLVFNILYPDKEKIILRLDDLDSEEIVKNKYILNIKGDISGRV